MRSALAAALALAAMVAVGCESSNDGGSTNEGGMYGVGGMTPSAAPQQPIDTTAGGISDRDTSNMDSPTAASSELPTVGSGRTSVDAETEGGASSAGTGSGASGR